MQQIIEKFNKVSYAQLNNYIQQVKINNQEVLQQCQDAIAHILHDKSDPQQLVFGIKFTKDLVETLNFDFIDWVEQIALPYLEEIGRFQHQSQEASRGKYFFSDMPNKEESQYGQTLLILVLESIQVWARWFPKFKGRQTQFKRVYDLLKDLKVAFPNPTYYKEDHILKIQQKLQELIPDASSQQSLSRNRKQSMQTMDEKAKQQLDLYKSLFQSLKQALSQRDIQKLNQIIEQVRNMGQMNLVDELLESDQEALQIYAEQLLNQEEKATDLLTNYQQYANKQMSIEELQRIYLGQQPSEITPSGDQQLQKSNVIQNQAYVPQFQEKQMEIKNQSQVNGRVQQQQQQQQYQQQQQSNEIDYKQKEAQYLQKIAELSHQLSVKEVEYEELKSQQRKIHPVDDEQQQQNQKLSQINNQLNQQIQQQQAEIIKLKNEITDFKLKQNGQEQLVLNQKNIEIDLLSNEIQQLKQLNYQIQKENEGLQFKIQQQEGVIHMLQKQYDEIMNNNQLNREDNHSQIEQFKFEIDYLKQQQQNGSNQIKKLQNENQELMQRIQYQNQQSDQQAQEQNEIQKMYSQNNELQKQMRELQVQFQYLQQENHELKSNQLQSNQVGKDMHFLQEQLKQQNQQYNQLESKYQEQMQLLEKLKNDEKNTKLEKYQLSANLDEHQVEIMELKQTLQKLQMLLSIKEDKIKELENSEARYKEEKEIDKEQIKKLEYQSHKFELELKNAVQQVSHQITNFGDLNKANDDQQKQINQLEAKIKKQDQLIEQEKFEAQILLFQNVIQQEQKKQIQKFRPKTNKEITVIDPITAYLLFPINPQEYYSFKEKKQSQYKGKQIELIYSMQKYSFHYQDSCLLAESLLFESDDKSINVYQISKFQNQQYSFLVLFKLLRNCILKVSSIEYSGCEHYMVIGEIPQQIEKDFIIEIKIQMFQHPLNFQMILEEALVNHLVRFTLPNVFIKCMQIPQNQTKNQIRQLWRQMKYKYKSGQLIFKTQGYDINKLYPQWIEINRESKQTDYEVGVGDLKLGCIHELQNKQFIIRLVIKPNNQGIIQIATESDESEICKRIITDYQQIFI